MDNFTIKRIEKILDGYIDLKVPVHVRSSVNLQYEWNNNTLTLCERRPDLPKKEWVRSNIVQFVRNNEGWHVYAGKEDGSFVPVSTIRPDPDFEKQLEQVELDSEGLFWIS
ncbi:DUF3024 domain-containing protein [Paenibacillus sp. F411]|uniref:DUF3024 domain-containing protein n=1 Tax=Paenibacillus algicola TaxID=2565926 RepID=A0A4P8XHS5_9BACL|nr:MULTISPECIES: DUF3024 domain-containing protein [Paenibacillus]MBO2946113.1 DUF3024 domain-containing protein [Paenibacillus sp. F411]QCT01743.1 hypothetical protein E6C60_1025 [Paenibacillus algicola]